MSNGRPGEPIRNKRRASRACVSCHTRKVRCDYLEVGHPCTNCRFDCFECHVAAKKRPRKSVTAKIRSRPAEVTEVMDDSNQLSDRGAIGGSHALSCSPQANTSCDTRGGHDIQRQRLPGIIAGSPSFSKHRMLHQVPHYAFLVGLTQAATSQDQESDAQPQPEDILSHLEDHEGGDAAWADSGCGEDEMAYLQKTGSLGFPDKITMAGFISVYFRIFHPFFPIVCKSTFLHDFDQIDMPRAKGPSLLLLQAILFIASGVREILFPNGWTTG